MEIQRRVLPSSLSLRKISFVNEEGTRRSQNASKYHRTIQAKPEYLDIFKQAKSDFVMSAYTSCCKNLFQECLEVCCDIGINQWIGREYKRKRFF